MTQPPFSLTTSLNDPELTPLESAPGALPPGCPPVENIADTHALVSTDDELPANSGGGDLVIVTELPEPIAIDPEEP